MTQAVTGAGLRKKRTELGLTLKQVSKASGVSQTYLSEMERNLREIPQHLWDMVSDGDLPVQAKGSKRKKYAKRTPKKLSLLEDIISSNLTSKTKEYLIEKVM